jgi:hypothetical protein
MIIALLITNLLVAIIICFIVATLFKTPITKIMRRLVPDDMYDAWVRYLMFAIYIVGISGGVRIWDLEKYLEPGKALANGEAPVIIKLTSERWVIEVYQTIIGSLQSNVWMLLVFFVFALIAFVIVRGFELKKHSAA